MLTLEIPTRLEPAFLALLDRMCQEILEEDTQTLLDDEQQLFLFLSDFVYEHNMEVQ